MSSVRDIAHALIDAIGPDTAIRDAWGAMARVVRAEAVAESLDPFDVCLENPLLGPPFVTLMRDQKPVSPSEYVQEVLAAPSFPAGQLLERERMTSALASGAAVKFNRMDIWNAPCAAAAGALREEFRSGVAVWGFYSRPGRWMFPWHRDHANSIVVQLEGTKKWILNSPLDARRPADPRDELSETHEVVLRPGDLLHLPYWLAHTAEAQSGASFHVTISVDAETSGATSTRPRIAPPTRSEAP